MEYDGTIRFEMFSVVVDSAKTEMSFVILLMIGIEMIATAKSEAMPRIKTLFVLIFSIIVVF